MSRRLTLIVAATSTNGIGQNSSLPWRLPQEMAYFARVTSNAPLGSINAVVMGRNTWESIPLKFRPLRNRLNVVISRNRQYELIPSASAAPVRLFNSLRSALESLAIPQSSETPLYRSFVIGGSSLYHDCLLLPPSSIALVDRILLTRILSPSFDACDVFLPDFQSLEPLIGENGESMPWVRASHEELRTWVGFDVPEGTQEEKGVKYEFQMWVR